MSTIVLETYTSKTQKLGGGCLRPFQGKVLTSVGSSQRMSPPSSSSSKSCCAIGLIQANCHRLCREATAHSSTPLNLAWSTKSRLEMLLLMSRTGVAMGVDLTVQLLGTAPQVQLPASSGTTPNCPEAPNEALRPSEWLLGSRRGSGHQKMGERLQG